MESGVGFGRMAVHSRMFARVDYLGDDAMTPAGMTEEGQGPARSTEGVVGPVHFLGVGGAGVSGALRIARAAGAEVSGSDQVSSRFADLLEQEGVEVSYGDDLLPEGVRLLVRSAAVAEDHPACQVAAARGVEVLKYAQFLGRLCPRGRTLAVAGTHGKTTASWMLYHALRGIARECGVPKPGALVGGVCQMMETNAVAPEVGGSFAVEACEYDRSFLQLNPRGALITNVEADHLDYYGDLQAIEEAFSRFVDRVEDDGLLVIGPEVPEVVEESAGCEVWRLGREVQIDLLGERRGRFRFRVRGPKWATPDIVLAVPGEFNVENAALALSLAVGLAARGGRIDATAAAVAAAKGIEDFGGVERRFELWGEEDDVRVYHDYAHHPTEVRVTLETARRVLPGRELHVLFQPHQHSRTARFLDDFVESLRAADRVVVADVYGARLHIDSTSAGSAELVMKLRRAHVDAVCGGALASSVSAAIEGLPAGSGLLVLGAGDVDGVRDELLDRLALRSAAIR